MGPTTHPRGFGGAFTSDTAGWNRRALRIDMALSSKCTEIRGNQMPGPGGTHDRCPKDSVPETRDSEGLWRLGPEIPLDR